MKKARQANLELLRIICMLMVVTAHLVNHGNMITFAKQGSAAYYLVWSLFGVSFSCITIYILISGYFLIDSRFSSWKLAKLGGQVFFYAFGITALFWLFGGAEKEMKIMVYSLLPISSDFYWFISMYVGMYLFAPLMNKLIRALTKRQLECAVALGFVLVAVWPNIIYFSSALNTAGGVSISWFLVAYLRQKAAAGAGGAAAHPRKPFSDRGAVADAAWQDQHSGRSDVGLQRVLFL